MQLKTVSWAFKIERLLQTIFIFGLLSFALLYFYSWPLRSGGSAAIIFWGVLVLPVVTDGILLLLHMPRKHVRHRALSFDSAKLTIVIACRNGAQIIGKTIAQAMKHVAPQQILVVSDQLTDDTAKVARSYGVQVIENEQNLNKAFSISAVAHLITTPYALVLDDDTDIGQTFIPTSLLDEGYGAVAFNVLPEYTGTILNKLQIFEYRKSMFMGKGLRGAVGAVGNVSGAIGLYHTKDLQEQAEYHSGQFGGEDQQRTMLVHLSGKYKGVTYTEATVRTLVPDTVSSFLRQRSKRWNMSLSELFILNARIAFSSRFHFLLRAEKTHHLYMFLTEPLRIVFVWTMFTHPMRMLLLYAIYINFGMFAWLKTGRKDPAWVIFAYPFFNLVKAICRGVAHLYWIKIKYWYIVKRKFHQRVGFRNLLGEYATVGLLLVFLWSGAMYLLYATQLAAKTPGIARMLRETVSIARGIL